MITVKYEDGLAVKVATGFDSNSVPFFFYILKSVKLNTFGFVYCFYNYSSICHNTASEDFLLQSHEYQISLSSLMDSKEGYEATAASIYP